MVTWLLEAFFQVQYRFLCRKAPVPITEVFVSHLFSDANHLTVFFFHSRRKKKQIKPQIVSILVQFLEDLNVLLRLFVLFGFVVFCFGGFLGIKHLNCSLF